MKSFHVTNIKFHGINLCLGAHFVFLSCKLKIKIKNKAQHTPKEISIVLYFSFIHFILIVVNHCYSLVKTIPHPGCVLISRGRGAYRHMTMKNLVTRTAGELRAITLVGPTVTVLECLQSHLSMQRAISQIFFSSVASSRR